MRRRRWRFVLIVLAIGSVVAGYVGVPHAIGGGNRIERYLEPSFEARRCRASRRQPTPRRRRAASDGAAKRPRAETAARKNTRRERKHRADADGRLHAVAFAGIGIAVFFFLSNPSAADRLAQRFRSVYNLLLHKYYVDEIYDAAIVQPIKVFPPEGCGEAWMRA